MLGFDLFIATALMTYVPDTTYQWVSAASSGPFDKKSDALIDANDHTVTVIGSTSMGTIIMVTMNYVELLGGDDTRLIIVVKSVTGSGSEGPDWSTSVTPYGATYDFLTDIEDYYGIAEQGYYYRIKYDESYESQEWRLYEEGVATNTFLQRNATLRTVTSHSVKFGQMDGGNP